MTEEDSGPSGESCSKQQPEPPSDSLSSQRVFKKSSPNNKLTLYLSTRDLIVSQGKIDRLQGVLLVDPEFVEDRKVYGQITLTFRYGREDEEVMGLKFCNEAVMCLAQLYPPTPANTLEEITPLQEALIKRLGPNAYPFAMEITPLAPPSVQLVPAKEYNGAPIGTSYDIRAYVADKADEKLHRRTTVRMGIRVVQKAFPPPSPYGYNPSRTHDPQADGGSKERGKHKIALFGCKSAPLDSTKLFAQPMQQQVKSKSVEGGLEIKNKEATAATSHDESGSEREREKLSSRSPSPPPNNKENADDSNTQYVGNKSPCKVTFQQHESEHELNKCQSNDMNENQQENIKDTPEHEEDRKSPSCPKRASIASTFLKDIPPPHAIVEKPFLLSDGRIELEASLNQAVYHHGEEVQVTVHVQNNSNKTIRRIKVFVVQHVDVCMFSNGKFKNVVAMINSKDDCPLPGGKKLTRSYGLIPIKSSTKNWIALEDSYTKTGTSLASTVTSCGNHPDERNVFAIYVSYYVKVKLILSVMGGDVSLKLPFSLMHTCNEYDPFGTLTRMEHTTPSPRSPHMPPSPAMDHPAVTSPHADQTATAAAAATDAVKPEKDGT